MKQLIPFFLLLFATTAFAQSPCDALNLVSVGYSPFTDSVIVVSVENNNINEIFDYPGFVLIDSNGDTVAKEIVNYFGIGEQSVHHLQVRPGVHDVAQNFIGHLQLYSGFYEDFECEWALNESLCTENECDSIIIAFANYGGALVLGDFTWSVTDSTETVLESGTFSMEGQEQHWEKRICLPKGIYSYTITPLEEPSGGGPTLIATTSPWYLAPTISMPLDWFNEPSATLEIPFYMHCSAAQEPNSIETAEDETSLKVMRTGGQVVLQCAEVMQKVEVFGLGGKLVSSFNPKKEEFTLPSSLKAGVYLMVVQADKEVRTIKVVL